MNNGRPRSWYAVPQPYTNQAPGQQAAPPPGAPDFPPVTAAPVVAARPASARYQHEEHSPRSAAHQQYDPQYHNGQARYASLPLAASRNGGPPAQAAAMACHWSPGHQARHSQPILPSQSEEPSSMLASPQVDVPVRAKSPKLGSRHVHTQSRQESGGPSLQDPSEVSRIRSPQPRRNTVPAPIMPAAGTPNEISTPVAPGRRPLPAPPQPLDTSRSASPAPNLSRSPSAASTASVSSSGSRQRKPLPQPPAVSNRAKAHDTHISQASGSRAPASYAAAQASVSRNTFPSHQYPGGFRSNQALPQEEPAHVQDVRSRIEQMTIKARKAADRNPVPDFRAPTLPNEPSIPTIQMPGASVPSFSFDEPDGPSSSTAPAISISVAPPSPSLKATSSEYFGAQLEDEHVPLPSSSVPMATSTKAHATACPKCQRPVLYGRTVNAMGQRWHPDCFVCEQCETKLEHMEFFTKDGRPYCHVDFHELFSIRCNHCKTPIVDESYITIDDPVLGKRQYHELHFFCANCGDPFIDPKDQGATASHDPELAAKPFTVHNGHPYCEACNLRLHRPKCNNCKKPISGDVLKALSKDWCEECFVCTVCRRPFEDGTFVVHQGLPHCELCLKRILIAANTS